ncbi:Hypothetical predicted protein [Podarcis lilfordi]|uniref:Uncharacterized protein n=1 Tax=Podarcis lilfordi TaxID=74358 RepID=A0AA35LGA3_9SAUR|nr:Hypothetical predicted protein [Podarcis lilfordi]
MKKCLNFKQTKQKQKKRLHLPVSTPVLNGVSLLGEIYINIYIYIKNKKPRKKTFYSICILCQSMGLLQWSCSRLEVCDLCYRLFLRRMLFPSSRADRLFSPLAVVVDYDDDDYNYSDSLFILFFFWLEGDPFWDGGWGVGLCFLGPSRANPEPAITRWQLAMARLTGSSRKG